MTTLMLFGDTERSAALRHEVPIAIGDSLLWMELDGRYRDPHEQLERDRIARALPDAEILDFVAFGLRELRRAGYSDARCRARARREVVSHLGIAEVTVPGTSRSESRTGCAPTMSS